MDAGMTTINQGAQPSWLRQNNFNFLRILFASLVLLSHAPELIDGNRHREILTRFFGSISLGELAVDGFFLLSGYLIVKSWQTYPIASAFLQKRVLRIYPAFIVASVIGALIVGPLGAEPADYFSNFSITSFLAGTVLLQPTITPPVFRGQPYAMVNGAMWTIFYEFTCYIAVLVLGSFGIVKRRRLWALLTCSVLTLYLLNRSGRTAFYGHIHLPEIGNVLEFPWLLKLFSLFLVGGCFYLFKDRIRFRGRNALLASLALAVGLHSYTFSEFSVAIFGGYLLFYVSQMKAAGLLTFNKLPDVSYGLYLYGWPVQKLLLWYFPAMSPWVLFPVSLTVSAILGLVSWKLIEEPCLGWKERKRLGGRLPTSIVPT